MPVAVQISGSEFLQKEGVDKLLTEILAEAEEKKPADLITFLQDGLFKKRKAEDQEIKEDGELPPFPAPAELKWRKVASILAKRAALGPPKADVEVQCRGNRTFPLAASDTALVIIDMQTDFLEASGRIGQHYQDSPVRSGLEGTQKLLAACRAAGLTVAHSRSHRYGSLVNDHFVGIDDVGYEIHPSLKPLPGEIVVDKWTFGAFASTNLEAELRKRGVVRILLCGVLTNVCIFATASQAVDRFIRVCLVEDACAAFNQEWHDAAVMLMNGPQTAPGHIRQNGLYFGECCKVADVEKALAPLAKKA